MSECPSCHSTTNKVKVGKNDSGSQRYQFRVCQRRYTPEPKDNGYPEALRQQAVKLHTDGISFRWIARHVGVDHVTVMHWVNAHCDRLPDAPLPAGKSLHIVEMDELCTFIGAKKTESMS